MNGIIRYWNQNRKKIIITIAIVALVIIVLQTLNNYLKQEHQREKSKGTQNRMVDTTNPIQSTLTGENVSEEKTKQNTDTIQEFVTYCNQKEYQKAYNLLTDACKEEFNNDMNIFMNQYCKNIFDVEKTYHLELWIADNGKYTYKITYYQNNLLATGSSSMNHNIEDYITISLQNGENKISVNGLIGKEILERSQKVKNVEITLKNRKIYKNYETYDITIKNYTEKAILISNGQDNSDICIRDKNKVEYASYLEEIPFENLALKSKYEKNITVKFNKIYDIYREIEEIQFKDIILDEEAYLQNNQADVEKIEIKIDL